jgi:TonB-dependent receptor
VALSTPASAQDTNTAPAQPEGGEIVVTGFRGSLNAALDAKREANGVVDVIKAEDIADFPDNNLAESIQRIPGVSINRDAGEGRNISVRGLGPLFTRVRINGMEGLSTTGGADATGGANRGRQFDFNTFASELFNSITVRKTASADVEEGSLGATVDLQTARPFDYDEDLTLVGSAAVGYNTLSESLDPKLAALVSTKLADDTIGVLLSAAYSERGILEEGPSTVRWEPGAEAGTTPPRPVNGGFNPASTLPSGATDFTFFHPRIPRYDSYSYETKRLGITGSIQWQPSDATLLTLDALYSDFKSNRAEQYLEAISFSRSGTGKPQTVILPGAVVDGTNSLVSGTFNNVDVRVESRYDELETEFQQYTATLNQDLGDRARFNVLGGYSKSDFSNPIQTTIALDALNVQGYSFDFSGSRNPTLTYGNLDVENAGSFVLGEIRLRPQYVTNDFKVARADFEYDATDDIQVRAGIDYKKYGFESQEYRRASETVVPALAPGQLATLSQIYSLSSETPLAGSPRSFVVPNIDRFDDEFGIYSNSGIFTLTGTTNTSAQGNWRTVNERDFGGFVQAGWDVDMGSWRFRGDAGIRYVETKQTSSGYTGGAQAIRVEAEHTYDNWLPSMNLSAEIDDFILRAAVARVMARPNLGVLNPTGAFSVSGGNRTYNIGNPFLDPTESTDLDFSAEWYFSREGALVLGLFYKNISTFVVNTAQQVPFNQLGLPESIIPIGPNGPVMQPTDLVTVTQPINSDGGDLKGFEIGIQTPFSFLSGALANFGIIANYTYVDSDIEYPLSTAAGAPVVVQPLTDLSKHAANATLYYEDDAFSIRGSVSYRGGYLQAGGVPGRNGVPVGTAPNFNPNAGQPTFNDVEGVHSTLNFDMSASYNINDHFTLTLEAINLTDEYVDQYIDSAADRLSVYHHTGRQFYFGGRYRF